MELVIDATLTDDPSLVGEAAHIVAEQPNGPRGNGAMPEAQRNSYGNLILLCNVHHKQVDDQFNEYTVQKLHSLKREHEEWVRTSLDGYNPSRQADDEIWATIVDEWTTRTKLSDWLNETWGLLQPTPGISRDFLDELSNLLNWILSRVWPSSHQALRISLTNFRRVLGDLINVFKKYSENEGDDYITTKRIYQLEDWDAQREVRMLRKFEYHVDLVEDLTCELTRAANLVCDVVRSTVDQSFRREEGVLLVRRGMDMNLREITLRPEYSELEKLIEQPYPGPKEFMTIRGNRNYFMGDTYSPDYFGHWEA